MIETMLRYAATGIFFFCLSGVSNALHLQHDDFFAKSLTALAEKVSERTSLLKILQEGNDLCQYGNDSYATLTSEVEFL